MKTNPGAYKFTSVEVKGGDERGSTLCFSQKP